MDGEVVVELVKLDRPAVPAEKEGSVALAAPPSGPRMGHLVLGRGHLGLLPANSAYRFVGHGVGVILLQTMQGDDTVERWADICLS